MAPDVYRNVRRRRSVQGFSLLELMVVIVIIGVIASLAMPGMLEARRDGRAYEDASSILELVRNGRTRAIGRGTAVMVSFDVANGSRGVYRMYEGVQPNPGGIGQNLSPRVSCSSTIANAWDPNPPSWNVPVNPNGLNLFIDGIDLNGTPETDANIWSAVIAHGLSIPGQNNGPGCSGDCVVNHIDLCFTPAGRPFVSVDVAPPSFSPASPFIGLLEVDVARLLNNQTAVNLANAGGLFRQIFIPPSGVARLASKVP